MADIPKKPLVYVTRKTVLKPALDLLAEKCILKHYDFDQIIPRQILLDEVFEADALWCIWPDKIDQELLDHAPKLKVVVTMSVGFEHINIEACKARKVLLGYTPNVLTETTAELAIALLLCTSRRIIEANKAVYNGTWGVWHPSFMCGRGLVGSTVGILGLGRIGTSIARKIRAFNPAHLIYHNRKPVDEVLAKSLGAEYVEFSDLLAKSDFLIISCQLNDSTMHVIDKNALNLMKPEAILINIGRGLIIDQEALYDALKVRRIRAAGLDVCTPEPLPKNHKLLDLDNLIILPHIGSATEETRISMAILTAENILAGLEGHDLPASIY